MTQEDIEQTFPEKHGIVPIGGPVAGCVHDRGLCALTAMVAAVAASRWLIGNGHDSTSVSAMGLYLMAAIAGYYVGKVVPPEQRSIIQVACTTVLAIVGGGMMGVGL